MPGDAIELDVNAEGQVVVYKAGAKGRSPARSDKRDLLGFFIGAHAAMLSCGILARDPRRYRSYFPRGALVTPEVSKE